jgi:phosphatidate cytidylyltransferase
MNGLLVRAVSAIFGITLIVTIYHFWQASGLVVISMLATIWASRELSKILFQETVKKYFLFRKMFLLVNLAILSSLTFLNSGAEVAVILMLGYSIALLVFSAPRIKSLPILSEIAFSIMGLFYIGWLPSFAIRLLLLNNGPMLFLSLLIIVFSGDTLAYLVGSRFGKTTLIPSVSPKKSLEGALGGLAGSMIAGFFLADLFQFDPIAFALVGFVTGTFGQMGDFFESLIKRVANVKDSGSIMPGHGGILDRVDGILFAAPVFYFLLTFV